MGEAGWPIDARGGDWDATALDHALLRGDAALTAFLLAHGADLAARHGHGDDALGTLSWASINEPSVPGEPDWAGCARAVAAHGLPALERDPSSADRVIVGGRAMRFSCEVAEALLRADA